MKLDPEYLRQHYASLSDEALLEVNRADLVEMARTVFDLEVKRRSLAPAEDKRRAKWALPEGPNELDAELDDKEGEVDGESFRSEEEPDWLEDAAEVYSHAVPAATAHSDDAMNARHAVEAAGIPCHLELCEIPPEASLLPYGTHRWRLMTPAKFSLRATSVLERDISNAEFEAGWKAQLEGLSDEELRELSPEVEFCGLYDRIERVEQAYDEEIARRKLK
jgi:hypothetical protein